MCVLSFTPYFPRQIISTVQPNRFCCDEGGREDASWKFQSVDAPQGWEKSGLLPFDDRKMEIVPEALIYHRPNNYYAAGWKGRSLKEVNAAFKELIPSSKGYQITRSVE